MSLMTGIEAIAGLMPIHLHLKKLYRRFHLRGFPLPSNHIIKSIINTGGLNKCITHHHLSLNKLMPKQQSWLHSLLIDMDDNYNEFLLSFSPFNKEFFLGKRLIDFFLDQFSFHTWTHNVKNHICDLDNIAINISNNPHFSIVLLDASIRNNVATSISHIHSHNRLVIKTIHHVINKDTRSFDFSPIFPCKLSWDFCKKQDCNSVSVQWRMTFQVLDLKERNFLKLLDDESNPLESSTIRGSLWLQYFSHSNSLCARATRAIVNHAPIGEYWLRFFPREEFACPYGLYPIKLRRHVLHKCKRFNNYWNPRRDSIGHFSQFLIHNSKAFSFKDGIASLNCS